MGSSFIEVAAAGGADALVGRQFPTKGGFDTAFSSLEIQELNDGEALGEFVVESIHSNAYGTLHGGAIGTLVDIFGTLALISLDSTRAGVSIDINFTCISPAKVGDRVVCSGKVLRAGRRIGMTEVRITNAENGKIVARGCHTKAM